MLLAADSCGKPALLDVASGADEHRESNGRFSLRAKIPAVTGAATRGGSDAIVREQVNALIGWGDPMLIDEKSRIVEFAANHKLPAIYQFRSFVAVGGLMSYGPD